MRAALTALTSVLLLAASSRATGETVLYTVHVGNNAPPANTDLPTLSYADDDAARFFQFVGPLARRAALVTVLDASTQRRYPGLAARSAPPRRAVLEEALRAAARQMGADRAAGRQVVFYFSYSGHGVPAAAETLLTLLDGSIDQHWMERHVLSLPADFVHLFIDACHAEGVVASRGVVQRVARATVRPLSRTERDGAFRGNLLLRHPNVGALLAASSSRTAHEWSQLQSGLFTHQLLSALTGAADVNLDGAIAYSEVAAFVSAANRAIDNAEVTPRVVSLPPRRDHNAPILARAWIRRPALLTVPPLAARFHIETEAGNRLLDAHPDRALRLSLLVPPGERLWVVRGAEEAPVTIRSGEKRELVVATLAPAERPAARGAVSSSLRRGLFATPFGKAYYQGWVDSHGELSVAFSAQLPEPTVHRAPAADSAATAHTPARRGGLVLPASCVAGGGALLAATVAFSVLAVQAHDDYTNTALQRPAQQSGERYQLYRGLAIGGGVASAALGVAAYLLWPRRSPAVTPGVSLGSGEMSVFVGRRW